mmetsp:Transcript_32523/g.52319  ORF Transcript_32523/g.52319 Transcript_32523/m.52319 type:complete len:241 (-) Transcript_32523:225-947(-)
MPSFAARHRDGGITLDLVHASDGYGPCCTRELKAEADKGGLQTFFNPLGHPFLLISTRLVPLAATTLGVCFEFLDGSVYLLGLPEALCFDQPFGLVRYLSVEVRGRFAIRGLLVAAHPRICRAASRSLLRLLWRHPGRRGIVQLYADVLRIALQPGFVVYVLRFVFLSLLDHLRKGLVVRLKLCPFLRSCDGIVPLTQPTLSLSFPVVALHKFGVYLKAFVGIPQSFLHLIQVESHHSPV